MSHVEKEEKPLERDSATNPYLSSEEKLALERRTRAEFVLLNLAVSDYLCINTYTSYILQQNLYFLHPATSTTAIDGGWSDWSEWSKPTAIYAVYGTDIYVQRTRVCDNPEPQYDGKLCVGDSTEVKKVSLPRPRESPCQHASIRNNQAIF